MEPSPAEAATADEEFAEFVASRQRSLTGLAFLLTGHQHDAQDLVQAALVKTYLRWGRLRRGHNVDAYVRKIIVNDHAGSWRRAWKRRERSTDTLPETVTPDRAGVTDVAWRHVLALPPRQRLVIALRFYDDLGITETAAILGCTTGTVKSQTSKAFATLRKVITIDDLEATRS